MESMVFNPEIFNLIFFNMWCLFGLRFRREGGLSDGVGYNREWVNKNRVNAPIYSQVSCLGQFIRIKSSSYTYILYIQCNNRKYT